LVLPNAARYHGYICAAVFGAYARVLLLMMLFLPPLMSLLAR